MNRSIYVPSEFAQLYCLNGSLYFLVHIANILPAVMTELFMCLVFFLNIDMCGFTLAFSVVRFPPNPPAPTKNKEN